MYGYHPTITLTLRWLGFSFGLSKLLSFRLWLTDRSFPLLPIADFTASFPNWLHTGLFALSMVCLLLLIIKPDKRILIILLVTETISCLADWNRLQPWEYFFLFLLLAATLNRTAQQQAKHWTWIISGLYFYSGFYKIDPGFVYNSFQNLILIKFLGMTKVPAWLLTFGYLPGILEMLAGIGLLFTKSVKVSAWFLISMHILILLVLGPLGVNQNNVVWPWNVFMIYMLWIILVKPIHASLKPELRLQDAVVILAWWIMPVFHMFGYWDAYLSGALYGGKAGQLYICPADRSCFPVSTAAVLQRAKNIPCESAVSVYRWAMSEMNIVPYPSKKCYKMLAMKWEATCPGNNHYFIVRSGFTYRVQEIHPGTTH